MGETKKERVFKGRRGGSCYLQSDEVEAEGSNKLLQTARRKRHREVIKREDRRNGGCRMPEVRNGGMEEETPDHIVFVPVRRDQEGEGRKGEGVGERLRIVGTSDLRKCRE